MPFYFQGYEYLVKWRDYRIEDCTWEPEFHLPESVVSNYIPSTVCTERLRQFSESFERAIKSRLRSRNPKSVIPVDYDLFQLLSTLAMAHAPSSVVGGPFLGRDGHS